MQTFTKCALAGAITLAMAQGAAAGTAPFFVPLTQSSAVAPTNSTNELNSPWQAPAGVSQINLMSMSEVEADVNQSVQRVNAGNVSSMFDMLAYDPSGRYLFIPHETPFGAGFTRYDTLNDESHLIFAGDQAGSNTPADWSNDFGAFDPSRYTPNGTLIGGEEWAGLGRVVELLDPFATPADPTAGGTSLVEGADWRVLTDIARVSHEGIAFSQQHLNEVIYYVDENNSGSIYKLVLKTPGDYTGGGTTYVLKIDSYAGDGTKSWNDAANAGQPRTGSATWTAITDGDGNPLTAANPFDPDPAISRPGRDAADEVNGTPYGRPEDGAISTLGSGNEAFYFTATSERAVYSIEELGGTSATVRLFASDAVTPKNVDFLPTTAELNSPDNLAVDALGNIYIIEDAPNGSSTGGDIWFARDMDNDGVAESLDHFLSLQVAGSEATGMIFNPTDPSKFVVSVQHPTSTDLAQVPNGHGDAVWEFDLAGVIPPACDGPRSNWMTFDADTRRWVRACSSTRDFNFVKQLENSGGGFPNP